MQTVIRLPGLEQFARRLHDGQRDALRMAERAAKATAALAVAEVKARTPRSKSRGAGARPLGRRHLRETVSAVRIPGPEPGYAVRITGPHALFVEEDTAAHDIFPRRALALRFPQGARVVFARRVRHPGTRGAHMLALGMKATARRSVRVIGGYLAAHTRSLARA